MKDIIIGLQNSDAWKIQLTAIINFVSSKDVKKERLMYSTSDNTKFTSCNDINEVVIGSNLLIANVITLIINVVDHTLIPQTG